MTKQPKSRTNLFYQLASDWIKLHRPDVAEAIWNEINKLIPLKYERVSKDKRPLPETLKELK